MVGWFERSIFGKHYENDKTLKMGHHTLWMDQDYLTSLKKEENVIGYKLMNTTIVVNGDSN